METPLESAAPEAEGGVLGLRDVLASGATFEWHHAVALVQQLLSQLCPSGDPHGNLPDASRIGLTSSGELRARLEPGPHQPLSGLGTLLHQLLTGRVQPAALRLLVMQASSADPGLSLATLREGLARWERPNRLQSLANLFAEAQSKGASPSPLTVLPQAPAPRAVTTSPLPPPPGPTEAPRRTGIRQPLSTTQVITGAAAVAFGGLLLAFSLLGGEGRDAAPAATTPPDVPVAPTIVADAQPVDALPAAPAATRPAVSAPIVGVSMAGDIELPSERGNARPPAAASATPRPPSAPSTPAPQPGPPAASASTVRPGTQPFAPSQPAARVAPPPASAAGRAPVEDPGLRPVAAAPSTAGGRASSAPIYTDGDPAVVPPVPRSYLPAPPEPGTPVDQRATLELVIDTQGRVESARLLSARPHFRDRWWISAAKTWTFEPAQVDGRPVRYRTRLTFLNGAASDPPYIGR
jgi:hypothetical protein